MIVSEFMIFENILITVIGTSRTDILEKLNYCKNVFLFNFLTIRAQIVPVQFIKYKIIRSQEFW